MRGGRGWETLSMSAGALKAVYKVWAGLSGAFWLGATGGPSWRVGRPFWLFAAMWLPDVREGGLEPRACGFLDSWLGAPEAPQDGASCGGPSPGWGESGNTGRGRCLRDFMIMILVPSEYSIVIELRWRGIPGSSALEDLGRSLGVAIFPTVM
ncbi:hypothetical protein F4778DRAFT_753191 [Xylariomycetidae sp. FL2044]|nr:hypothetical protein F4778DRAFT_753191 [Xylariomycetidae sp. FL2044]